MYCPLLFTVEGLGPKGGGRVAPLDWDEGDREARTCVIKDGTGVYNTNVTIMLQCYNYCFITEAHEGMRTQAIGLHTGDRERPIHWVLDTGYIFWKRGLGKGPIHGYWILAYSLGIVWA